MLTGLIVFLLVFFALLAIPVTLTFQISWRHVLQGNIRLLWLFGLVRIPIPISQTKGSSHEGEESVQAHSRQEHPPRKKQNLFTVIRQKSFRRRVFLFFRDIWHALHKRNLKLRVRIGLGDPADTGQLWAVIGPVSGILAGTQAASFEFEPEFYETVFELDSSGSIRLVPLQILYLTIGLLLSPPLWQAVKQARKAAI